MSITRLTTGPEAGHDGERILIVDDDESLRPLLVRALSPHYHCSSAASMEEACALLHSKEFALVLCDVEMPGHSGLELVEYAATNLPQTAVVMISGLDDPAVADRAHELGAYGYLLKPLSPKAILINVSSALRRRRLELVSRAEHDLLEHAVARRTAELRRSREETIRRLSRAAEYRDQDTGQHIQRVSRYCHVLSAKLGLEQHRCELLRIASPLHDIGKIAIPDSILGKHGPLTPEERELMQRHAQIGHDLLAGANEELLDLAALVALTHHERWDGTGYPRGLRGEEIPIEGRILAVADVFDALTSDRVYRTASTVAEALGVMKAERGTHFDPAVLDAFLDAVPEITRIQLLHRDAEPPVQAVG
jgi:putative two-component system response regulator